MRAEPYSSAAHRHSSAPVSAVASAGSSSVKNRPTRKSRSSVSGSTLRSA
jgi:hypothetical protein